MATATAHLQKPETRRARQLKWSTPRWSRARGLNKLVPTVFGVGPIVLIVGVSTIVGAAICAGVKLAFPLIQLGFAWQALLAIPAMFAHEELKDEVCGWPHYYIALCVGPACL